jgi:hypothetical protein
MIRVCSLHRIGNSWAGRAFYQHFVRYWAVVPGRKFSIEQQNKNFNFLFVYWQTFRQKVINCPAIANAWPLAEILNDQTPY